MIYVNNAKIITRGQYTIISANVDIHHLYFKVPNTIKVELRGEVFLPFALFWAIQKESDVSFEENLPLCPTLFENLDKIKAIYRQWNTDFRDVSVTASLSKPEIRNESVLSSFSGGVDSMSTLQNHQAEISHLLVINGFDDKGDTIPFSELSSKLGAFAAATNKVLIPVETNIIELANKYDISWSYLHGAALCGIAAMLAPRTYYIPSTYTARELKPWGSHPLLDFLWSTNHTQVVHDGFHLRRSEKTTQIATDPQLLNNLQVCWYHTTQNCGKCSKCIRTMLVLQEIGVSKSPFPAINASNYLDALKLTDTSSASFIWDLMKFMQSRGNVDLAKKLRKRLDRYALVSSFKSFLKSLLGKRVKAIYDRINQTGWVGRKIILRDPDNFQ